MAIDFPVGNDFPANGNQIPDGEIYEGFYWDAATGAWKRLCERDKIGDCLDDNIDETVCDKLDVIQREIVELEEEIDAIATSVDRGSWAWDFNVSNYLDARLGSGKFYMVRDSDLAVVTDYKDAGRIVFHEDDLEGENHVFDDTLVDKVLMLFDRPDDDFIESVITAIETTSGTHGTAYIVHVNVAQSKGSPTNAPDAEGVYKARLNIFEQPSGGTVGEYVLKAGGNPGGVMTGDLTLNTTNDNQVYDHNQVDAKLTFKNTTSTDAKSYANIFKTGSHSLVLCDQNFGSQKNLVLGENFNIHAKKSNGDDLLGKIEFKVDWMVHKWDDKDRFVISNDGGTLKWDGRKQAEWSSTGGKLLYNNNERLVWNSSQVYVAKPVSNGSSADGFTLKGATTNNNNYTSDTIGAQAGSLLAVKHVANKPDHIEYRGKITTSTDIVNKAYVDNNVNGNVINGNWNGNNSSKITITKTSNVYYITGG